MSSIRNMMRQANPGADEEPATKAQAAANRPRRAVEAQRGRGEGSPPPSKPLRLPAAPPMEERKPWSTRLKPSLKKTLEAYVQEIRDAGFAVTQEIVLDALLRELRDNDTLRNQIAETVVRETSADY